MNIDRNNYEMYFLDYLEGRLTADEVAGLLLFAEENPDLKELLEGEELLSLVPDDTIYFKPKSALKKQTPKEDESGHGANPFLKNTRANSNPEINSHNYEEFIIRFYDNDLDEAEQTALANFLKDSPTYIREFEIFGNTLLKPETGIIYPHKSRLKRNVIQLPGFKKILAVVAVAASVLLFSTLFLKNTDQPIPKEIEKQLAGTNNSSDKNIKTVIPNDNTTEIKSSEIKKPANTVPKAIAGLRNTNTSEKSTSGVITSLKMIAPKMLATTPIAYPDRIEPCHDFDGITSIAYYDPDPDALPLNTDAKTRGGRLGSALAQGISQTAGTIAREPEVGRLLRGKISLSDIAGLGLAGFNLITDSKLSISRDYDTDGNLKGYSLNDGDKRLTRLP